jgi:hypothetical protein
MATDVDASDVLPVLRCHRFQRSELMPFRIDFEYIDLTMPLEYGFQDLVDMNDLASHRIGRLQFQGRINSGPFYSQTGYAPEVADRLAARLEPALEGLQVTDQAVIGHGGRLMAVDV